MKTFQDLYINIPGFSIQEFADLLTNYCGSQWKRAYDKEKDVLSMGEVALCFERLENEDFKNAGLTIFEKTPGTVYVPNIVPIESGQLTTDEYNKILNNFIEIILAPATNDTNISYSITKDKIFIEDVVGKDTAKLLENFSVLANKSTGGSHPLDQKRWFRFLVAVNNSDIQLYSDLLESTLVEQGWSSDMATKLVIEFEFAQALLDYTKGK